MTRKLILAAMATALLASSGLAQNTTKTAKLNGKRPVNDALFVTAAGTNALHELAISQLGAERSTDEALKKFSEEMLRDYTKARQDLMVLAGKKKILLSVSLDKRTEFSAHQLQGLSGEDFNRSYAKAQLTANREAVDAFEAEAERGQDRDVKAWAAKMLPTWREHLKQIKALAGKHEEKHGDESAEHKEK